MVMDTKFLWVSSAPFGLPEEPEVYTMVARSSVRTVATRSFSSSSETVTPRPSKAPSALPSIMRICFKAGQWSLTESSRSKRSRLSAKASLTTESFMMRWACGAESVS